MPVWLDTHYLIVASSIYFFALIWAALLGVGHRLDHPRAAARIGERFHLAIFGMIAAWTILAVTLTAGVEGDLRSMGFSFSLFAGFQMLVVWVSLPAGVRWGAHARVLKRRDATKAGSTKRVFPWGGPGAFRGQAHGETGEETWGATAAGKGREGRWTAKGWREWSGPVCVGVLAIVFSHLVLAVSTRAGFPPEPSPETTLFFQPVAWREIGLILMIFLAAPIEEVVFRLVLQGRLEVWARRRGWTALVPVAVASFLWTMGHAGMVEPRGLKEFQIFALGLLFGWTRLRWGVAAAIVAHGVLNGYAALAMLLARIA